MFYLSFPKVNMLLCWTVHTTLFGWTHFIVFSVPYETKEFANEVCSWTHFKCAKTHFDFFVSWWKRDVSMLSSFAVKSYGGSHIRNFNQQLWMGKRGRCVFC